MSKMIKAHSIVIMVLLSGCMTYRNIPQINEASNSSTKKISAPLEYKIEGNAMFAGPSAIRNVIDNEAPFGTTIPAEKEVSKGYYLSVQIQQLAPSVSAVVFGYISVATFTLIPFWSTNDGASLTFTLYKDGTKLKAKEYTMNRGTFVWMPMVLVAWVNLFTPSEEEAFQAAARDFLTGI